jgi:hypothetical protein
VANVARGREQVVFGGDGHTRGRKRGERKLASEQDR